MKDYIANLPSDAGIYKFFDKENTIIYVGKAKNLKNRVSSYFTDSKQHSRKTLRLVSQIIHIEFTVVGTEKDALLLENSLIKEYQPKYNILLKDDKTYPYLLITTEPFPRLLITRKLDRSLGTFYGPYSNVRAMNSLLELFKQLYTIRTCSLALSRENIEANKFKVCLEFHIKNCKGPCENLQTEMDYLEDIWQVREILKGNISQITQIFKDKMLAHAEKLEFEKANIYKTKTNSLTIFQEKSVVVNAKITDLLVITLFTDEDSIFLNFLEIKNGAIIHTDTFEAEKKLEETNEEILIYAIFSLKDKYNSNAKEVITNIETEISIDEMEIYCPKIGDKKKLIDMSVRNALFAKKEKLQKKAVAEETHKHQHALLQLQQDLRLKELPTRIECFDNSNIQGTNPVASMVYFRNGQPAKKDYRHFNIKTVEGPDDFASMYEIVTRRYKRLQEEGEKFPKLIIVDGGKGQLSFACQALKDLGIYGQIPIIGIAKRLEEIYFPEDSIPLHISKKSESLKLIQRIRDEAHRFAITFHRDKRSKNSLNSELEEIKGIADKTLQKLMVAFKSISKMKEASETEIITIVGKAKAKLVLDYFKEQLEEKKKV